MRVSARLRFLFVFVFLMVAAVVVGLAYSSLGAFSDYIDVFGQIVSIPSVVQGGTDDDFTKTMPIATIFIDEDVVFRDAASRNGSIPSFLYDGSDKSAFIFENVTYRWDEDAQVYLGYEVDDAINLSFDTSVRPLVAGQDNYFDGDIYEAVFPNGAAYIDPVSGDRTDYDVVITYSNLHINVDSNSTGDKISLWGGNAILLGHDYSNAGNYRYGVKVDVNIKVVDKLTGQPVDGTFYYPMVDLDVYRGNLGSFANIYGADEVYSNRYSEQIVINGGLAEGKIWIPGAIGQPYKAVIQDDGVNGLSVSSGPNTNGDSDTFYTGFATLVDNTNGGLDFTYRAAAGSGVLSGIETYLLSGKNHINWMIKSSTGVGGNIQTTRYGNHNGELNDGSEVYGSSTLTVATGQTVVYTMTPDPGYRLKDGKIKINRSSIDFDDGETVEVSPTPVDSDNDGIPDYYVFSFDAISSDSSIHVEWEKTVLSIVKRTIGSGKVNDSFTFHIKAWNPDDQSVLVDFTDSTDIESNQRFSEVGNGIYSFTISSDEVFNISSEVIPAGWEYEISEVQSRPSDDEYGTNYDDWIPVGSTIVSGILPMDDTTDDVVFTNKRKKVVDDAYKLTVRKIWEDDIQEIRPSRITMNIEKPAVVGLSASAFKGAITGVGIPNAQITGIFNATLAEYEAAVQSGTTPRETTPTQGTEKIYSWANGTDVYFYCPTEIYLTGTAYQMFYNFTSLRDISGLSALHTDFVTSFEQMFGNDRLIADLSPLSNWNTANVTNMAKMFAMDTTNGNSAASQMSIQSLEPLRDWQTQNVTTMRWMFRGGGAGITDLEPLSEWDVSRVVNFEQMFFRTCSLDTANTLSSWDIGRGDSFTQMFDRTKGTTYAQSGLNSADLSKLPDWTIAPSNRTGSWNNGGTFVPSSASRTSTSPTNMNNESDFWNGNSANMIQIAEHDVDENDENVWIYEFEVPNKGSEWKVYETLPAAYESRYTTRGEKENASPVVGKGRKSDPIMGVTEGQTAVIYNTRVTREVILKITWDDDDDALGLRPDDTLGSIDYTVGSYNGSVSTENDWSVSGNVWTKTFRIPFDASIPDWNELVPNGYKMISKTHIDGTNLYEFVNSLGPYDLTIKKETIGNESGVFDFEVRVYSDGLVPDEVQAQTGTLAYIPRSEIGGFVYGETSPVYRFTASSSNQQLDLIDTETDWLCPSNQKQYRVYDVPDDRYNYAIILSDSSDVNALKSDYVIFIGELAPYMKTEIPLDISDVPGLSPKVDVSPQDGIADDGVYTFSLSVPSSDDIVIHDIPYGYRYDIVEVNDEDWYNISKTNASGTMVDDTVSSWVNAPYTEIAFYKQWNDGDKKHTASELLDAFSIYRDGENVSSLYIGNIKFTIWGNGLWECSIDRLPKYSNDGDRYAYRVVESNIPNGYDVSYSNPSSAFSVDGDTIAAAADGDTITNTELYDLTITKDVVGGNADLTKVFDFTVKILDHDSLPLDLTAYGGSSNGDGTYTFSIPDKGTITVTDIPRGYLYEVTEANYTPEYSTSVDGTIGMRVAGTLNSDTDHSFVNTARDVVITGVSNGKLFTSAIFIFVSFVLPVPYIIVSRKARFD